MSLQKYLLDLYYLEKSLPEIIEDIVRKKEGFIVGLVKNRLYQTGRDGTGNLITPSYALSTVKRKKEDNKRASFVTLRDTGAFYDGFFIELENYVLLLNSTDGKTESLIDKYSESILHFTKEEQDLILLTIIEPELEKLVSSLGSNSNSATGGLEMDFF